MTDQPTRDYGDAIASFVAAVRAQVKAEQERDAARATLARIEALAAEPYILADVLCRLYHDFEPGVLTGFVTDRGFVVSCALCKARAHDVLAALRAVLDGSDR